MRSKLSKDITGKAIENMNGDNLKLLLFVTIKFSHTWKYTKKKISLLHAIFKISATLE